MKKIYVSGGIYGHHNIGDEAVLYSTIETFRQQYNVTVASDNPIWINKRFPDVNVRTNNVRYSYPQYGIRTVPRNKFYVNFFREKEEQIFMKKIDGYVCGGGTVLSDCPWHAMTLIMMAIKAQKPVITWGSGMAEGNDANTNYFIKEMLNNDYVRGIFVRDEFVQERLTKIGVNNEKIMVCYDPAIMIRGEEFDLGEYLTQDEVQMINNDYPNFAVSISGESDVLSRTPVYEIIEALKNIRHITKCNIILIPSGCGAHCKDIEIHNAIKLELGGSVITLNRELSPQNMVWFLKKVSCLLSSRLHMNIFSSLESACGFVSLVRNDKLVDYSKIMQQPYLYLKDLNSKAITEACLKVMENGDNNKKHIMDTINSMQQRYIKSFKKAIDIWNI